MTEKLDALGADSSSLGHGRSRRTLSDEVEQERSANVELQEGSPLSTSLEKNVVLIRRF